jgi:hypothetical protein
MVPTNFKTDFKIEKQQWLSKNYRLKTLQLKVLSSSLTNRNHSFTTFITADLSFDSSKIKYTPELPDK